MQPLRQWMVIGVPKLGVASFERVNGYGGEPLAPPVDQPGVEGLLKSKVAPGGGGGSDGDGGGDGGGAGCAQISNPAPVIEESLCHSISSLAAIITPSGPLVPQYLIPPTRTQSKVQSS